MNEQSDRDQDLAEARIELPEDVDAHVVRMVDGEDDVEAHARIRIDGEDDAEVYRSGIVDGDDDFLHRR